ncbi:hypothetical protein [Dokdonella ginsengisoli]|uniref:Uncharacterized protein n=1 Tax=Dokdonella ginsengisoli TaxID=363846 RepID=A0ABV9QYW6_9GAMM
MNTPTQDPRRMRCFATFETSASDDDIRMLLLGDSNCEEAEIRNSSDSPPNASWFDVYADENRLKAAMHSTVSVLLVLDEAADRGLLHDFKVLAGARIWKMGTRKLRWKPCRHYRSEGAPQWE